MSNQIEKKTSEELSTRHQQLMEARANSSIGLNHMVQWSGDDELNAIENEWIRRAELKKEVA